VLLIRIHKLILGASVFLREKVAIQEHGPGGARG
jgi:hypothetical protein